MQLRPRGVRTLFLYTYCNRTYCLDFTPFRDGRGFVLSEAFEFKIDDSLVPLEDLKVSEIARVIELFVSAASAPDGLRLEASHVRAVLAPLKCPARGKKRRRAASESSESSDASREESDDSAEAPIGQDPRRHARFEQ